MRKLAAKKLTASDLTLFEWQFRNRPAGNQKAINLNAEVFIEQLYPALPEIAQERGGKLPLGLSIYGPGRSSLDRRRREIMKHGSYKNWRLDGEFISDKPDEPGRYKVLAPGDLAIFEFFGSPVPTAANMILLAKAVSEDAGLILFFESILGRKSMVQLSASQVDQCIREIAPPDGHPVREFEVEASVEDAALGGIRGIEKLKRRSQDRHITHEELLRTRRNMEEVGRLGEELLNQHFEAMLASRKISGYEWVSDVNAVAPYDFRIMESEERLVLVDVKATSGEFERPLHISLSELRQMVDESARYDLYRVYDAGPDRARVRIARDLRSFAFEVLHCLQGLPKSVRVDSVSVLPSSLPFGEEITLEAEEA